MVFSKYIDAAAKKLANNKNISFEEALDDISSLVFDSNCDLLDLFEWHLYPQLDIDFVY